MKNINLLNISLFAMTAFLLLYTIFKNEIIKGGYYSEAKYIAYITVFLGFSLIFIHHLRKNKRNDKK